MCVRWTTSCGGRIPPRPCMTAWPTRSPWTGGGGIGNCTIGNGFPRPGRAWIIPAGTGMERAGMDDSAQKPRAARRLVDQQRQEPARRQPQRQPARQPRQQRRFPVSPELPEVGGVFGPDSPANAFPWGGCPVQRPAASTAAPHRGAAHRKAAVAWVGGAETPREDATAGRLFCPKIALKTDRRVRRAHRSTAHGARGTSYGIYGLKVFLEGNIHIQTRFPE